MLPSPMLILAVDDVCHVYIDRKTVGGAPFYVGKGKSYRVKRPERNNKWHSNTREKYPDWNRQIVETASEALCNEFEIFLIAEIGRRDLGNGPLVNLTDGGEGTSGVVRSAETRAKMSAAKMGKLAGEKHPLYGKTHSAEARAKMSAAQVRWVCTDATRLKMSLSHKGVPKTPKHRAAISAASMGKPGTTTGRKLSDEQKAKIAAGGKAYRDRKKKEALK